MILLTPASTLFTTSLLISTLLALTSANWLLAWIAMEINLLSFIPLMYGSKSNQEAEACIKYFLAQALGSATMILSSMSLLSLSQLSEWWPNMLILSLLLKLGAAPCHSWFPSVMTSLSWIQALLLTTWQKLAPLSLLCFSAPSMNHTSHTLISLSAVLNALLGGILGMNQAHLRTLLAYSSITHMGWVISAIQINNPILSMSYFFLYTLIAGPLFITFHLLTVSRSSQLLKLMITSKLISMMLIILLLSLGGLPPLTGFLPKWLIINELMQVNHITLLGLLLGSYLNLYFYLNLAFNILSSLTLLNMNPNTSITYNFPLLILPATSALGLIMVLTYALTLLYQP